VGLALVEKRGDAFVRIGHQRVHGHNVARVLIRGVLVHLDLGVKGALADAHNQLT
jgi:hypothetical protein